MKALQKLPEVKDTNDPDKMVMIVGEILKDPREDKKIISKVAKVCVYSLKLYRLTVLLLSVSSIKVL